MSFSRTLIGLLFSFQILLTSCTLYYADVSPVTPSETKLPPSFELSQCLKQTNQDQPYSCQVSVLDTENSALSFNFEASHTCSSWLTVNSNGLLSGTPTDESVGDCIVSVDVSNGSATATQSYILTITNNAPTLVLSNPTALLINAPLTEIRTNAQVQASEEGHGVYSLDSSSIVGTKCTDHSLQLTINSETGSLHFQPANNFVGSCKIRVQFDDQNNVANSVTHAEITVVVNDQALSVISTSVNEDAVAGKVVVTVSVPSPANQTITFDYSTIDSTATSSGATKDFDATSGSASIAAGATSTTIEIPITNDNRDEADQKFTLQLSNANGASINSSTEQVTIVDDDATPSISVSSDQTVAEDVGNVSVDVTLSGLSENTVTVTFATSSGTATHTGTFKDYDAVSKTITFSPGDVLKTELIPITDDPRDEDDQAFTVAVSSPTNGTLGTSSLTVTLTDNDLPPSIELSLASVVDTDESVARLFNATLSGISEKTITFTNSTSSGTATATTDYTPHVSASRTIAAGSLVGPITVAIVDDTEVCEPDETYTVTLADFANVTAGTVVSLGAAILENDFPQGSIASNPVIEGASTTATITLSTICPSRDLNIAWRTIGGSATLRQDLDLQTGTLIIEKNKLSGKFNVTTLSDTSFEGDENFGITATWTGGSGMGYVTITDDDHPAQVAGLGVSKVYTAGNNSCALLNNGQLKCWGPRWTSFFPGDDPAKFGNKPTETLALVNKVPFESSLEPVEVGLSHGFSCARMSDGSVRCYGNFNFGTNGPSGPSYYGQLGQGFPLSGSFVGTRYGTIQQVPPINLGTGRTATKLAVGLEHVCALLDNSKVKCWGRGQYLGIGTISSGIGDTATEMGNSLPYVDLGTGFTPVKIRAGMGFTCALSSAGKIKCWGIGSEGRTGQDTTATIGDAASEMGNNLLEVNLGQDALDLDVGAAHTCAKLANESLKCWGNNTNGRLGLGIGATLHMGDTAGEMAALPTVNLGTGVLVEKLSVGQDHTCVITKTGTVKCWGRNDFGQLGLGSNTDRGTSAAHMGDLLPTLTLGDTATDLWASGHKTCAKLQSGIIKCWGYNANGSLGLGNENNIGDSIGENPEALTLGVNREFIESVKAIDSTALGNCYLLRQTITSKKELYCFGDNRSGYLGLENMFVGDGPGEMGVNLPTMNLSSSLKVTDMVMNSGGGCALFENNKIKCWGVYYAGAFGTTGIIGDTPAEVGDAIPFINLGTGLKAIKLVGSTSHNCALFSDYRMKCWGDPAYNRMGIPGFGSSYIGDAAGEIGDSLPFVNVGTNQKVIDIIAGRNHTCAFLDSGDLKCWGYNGTGGLGIGNATDVNSALQMGNALIAADPGLNKKFVSAAAGHNMTCAIRDDQKAVCWGSSTDGGLGNRGVNIADGPNEMGLNLIPIDFGSRTILDLYSSTVSGLCARFNDLSVKCWGTNNGNSYIETAWGRLGTGVPWNFGGGADNLSDRWPAINLGTNVKVKSMAVNAHTCAVTDQDKLKCWGYNLDGRLGLEDSKNRGVASNEMGDYLPFVDLGLSAGSVIGSFIVSGVSGGADNVVDSLLGDSQATVAWTSATGATQYLVSILADDKSTVVCSEQTTAATTFTFVGCPLSTSTHYFVRLIATDGVTAQRSATNTLFPFYVNTSAPPTFTISGITGDVDTVVDANLADGIHPTVNWIPADGSASRYQVSILEADGITEFCSPITVDGSVRTLNLAGCSLTNGSTYHAVVKAVSETNQTTSASNSPFVFTTGDSSAPSAFSITGITGATDVTLDNQLGIGTRAEVNWQDSTGENSYSVTIYESDGTTVKCATAIVPLNTTKHFFDSCDLTAGSSYNVDVTANDILANTTASNSQYTFTVASTPSSFLISGVTGGSNDVSVDSQLTDSNSPTIHWTNSSGAGGYYVYIRDYNDLYNVCSATANPGDLSIVLSSCFLQAQGQYRVSIWTSTPASTPALNNGFIFTTSDFPKLSINKPTATEGSNLVFNVTMDKIWGQDVTVKYRSVDVSATNHLDFTPTSGTLTITAGNLTGTITVATRDDITTELDEKMLVSLYEPNNASLSAASIGLATIQDNEILSGSTIVAVRTGGSFSCALTQDGRVKCWGSPTDGRLGYPHNHFGDEPSEAGDGAPVVDLGTGFEPAQVALGDTSSGGGSTCALSSTGTVKCWGHSNRGSLGQGNTTSLGDNPGEMGNALPLVNLGGTATEIQGGSSFFCARMSNNKLKCWGANSSGQLGYGDTNDRGDGAGEMGASLPEVNLGTGLTVKKYAVGSNSVCAILSNDTTKCWGANGEGQLGKGNTTTIGTAGGQMGDSLLPINLGTGLYAKDIKGSNSSFCAILNDDTVKCWGYNYFGQFGTGGGNRGDANGEMGDSLIRAAFPATVSKISMGSNIMCGLLTNNQVMCFGDSDYGKLGRGHSNYSTYVNLGSGLYAIDISTVGSVTCARLNNNQVKCWGYGLDGRLANGQSLNVGDTDDEMGDYLPPLNLGTALTVEALGQGHASHNCFVGKDGSNQKFVKCYGPGTIGQLGRSYNIVGDEPGEMGNNLRTIDFGTNEKVIEISLGSEHGCALFETGKIKCWGSGSYWRNGNGTTLGDLIGEVAAAPFIDIGTNRKALTISLMQDHTCFLSEDFESFCFGIGSNGNLVNGNLDHTLSLTYYGDNLIKGQWGANRSVLQISAGANHTCALLDNFTMKCAGGNASGQLGKDDIVSRGGASATINDLLTPIQFGSGLVPSLITTSYQGSCALFTNNQLKCWGYGGDGRLGIGGTANQGITAGQMLALPVVPIGADVAQLTGRNSNFCSLHWTGATSYSKCWGNGSNGRLGYGSATNLGDSAGEVAALTAHSLGTGRVPVWIESSTATCALLDNNSVKCWGQGNFLGTETTHDRADGANEMGDFLPALDLGN